MSLSSRLGSDLALALDPVALAQQLRLTPDPWQADLLRSEARQRILLCCRQAGKSTVSALLALHSALYRPPALVLLLSPSLRQSQELYRKVRSDYRALGDGAPGVVEETALRLELSNGSRIVSLPGARCALSRRPSHAGRLRWAARLALHALRQARVFPS